MVEFLGLSGVQLVNFVWITIIFFITGVFFSLKIMINKNYPLQVIIHHDNDGTEKMPISNIDKARLIAINKNGDKILWLKKHKVAKPFSGTYVGKNKIAYAIKNNNWYNISYSGISTSLRSLGIEPVDQNHRLVESMIVNTLDLQYPDQKANRMFQFMILAVIVIVALNGFILYKNLQVSKDTSANNLQAEKERSVREEKLANSYLNITESLGNMINYASQLGRGSGAR